MSAMKPSITQLRLYFTEGDIWLKITSVFARFWETKRSADSVFWGVSGNTPNKTKLLEALNSLHLVHVMLATFYLEWINLCKWRSATFCIPVLHRKDRKGTSQTEKSKSGKFFFKNFWYGKSIMQTTVKKSAQKPLTIAPWMGFP